MREIRFRGKRKDNGQWIESGSVCRCGDDGINWDCFLGTGKPAIYNLDSHGNICASATLDTCMFCVVDSETVGQFTGLTDKNGKKIFEGDIVTIQNDSPFEMTGYIEFGSGCFELHDPTCDMYECLWYRPEEMEVIGNIHDNPELLGGAEDGKAD